MTEPVLRPLTAGEILDGAFTIYRRHFVPLITLSVVIQLPTLISIFAAPASLSAVSFLCASLLGAALVFATSEAYLGRPVALGGAVSCGVRNFIPILIGNIAYMFMLIVGFLLLLVPGVLFAMMFYMWQPVTVLEGRFWPFGRARALARNAWGKIGSLMLLTFLITGLPGLAIGFGAFVAQFQATSRGTPLPVQEPTTWVSIATVAFAALSAPFSSAVITLLYYDQRVRKEGLGVEMQAAALGPAPRA